MANRSLLSIFVPTYNRVDYLSQCLDSILPQASELGVSVIVSDNNSTDTTSATVLDYQKRYETLTYFRHPKNTGLDGNQLSAFDQVKSKYFLWLGDDDLLLPDALRSIVKELERTQPSLLFVNANDFVTDVIDDALGTNMPRQPEDPLLDDCRVFLRRYCYKMLYGTLIVNMELAKRSDPTRFKGTNNAFSGAVLEYLAWEYRKEGRNIIVVDGDPKVGLRKAEKTWHREAADLALLQVPSWFRLLDPLYEDEVASLLPQYVKLQTNIFNLLRHRASGALNIGSFGRLLGNCPASVQLKGLWTLTVPAWLVGAAIRFKQRYIVGALGELLRSHTQLP